METFWVITILVTGVVHPLTVPADAAAAGFVTGLVDTKTVLYFETEEGCNTVRDTLLASAPASVANSGLISGKLDIEACKSVQMEVVRAATPEENTPDVEIIDGAEEEPVQE